MSTEPLYSLVVMTQNRPGPLKRCLGSIDRLSRGRSCPEVILVDDGSDPPARVAASDYPSLNIITVRLDDRGVAAARNAGIKKSTGDLIAFIADDYVLPESYLKDIECFFRDNPSAQAISHNIAPRGASMLQPVQQLYFDLVIGQEIPPDQAGQDIIFSYTLPASRAAMFRREVFDQVGFFNENLRVGEDGEFGRRMADAGIPVYLFCHKRVDHYDAQKSRDYFRQRLRYGRSLIRSGISGLPLEELSKTGFLRMVFKMLINKLRQWWALSGRLGNQLRFIVLSPFLLLFLCFFYYGAYAQFCEQRNTSKIEP